MSGAAAQLEPPVGLDPATAGQGTTLLVTAGESALAPGSGISVALARGTRVDAEAVRELCTRRAAARSACPDASRIGFGRFNLAVAGYEPGGGEAELAWSLDAFLGEAQRRGDVASVVLIGNLLGADLVSTLLPPAISADVPRTTTTIGRLRRTSGRYSVELAFDRLPVQIAVDAPATAAPARLELTLGAVRRVRKNFTRRFRVEMPSGTEVRKIRDHRLVGKFLFRAPSRCRDSWPAELRSGSERSRVSILCSTTP